MDDTHLVEEGERIEHVRGERGHRSRVEKAKPLAACRKVPVKGEERVVQKLGDDHEVLTPVAVGDDPE